MKRIVAVAAAAALLGACGAGGGDKAAMAAQCVKEGTDQKTCDCVTDELEKNLDKETFHAMALQAQGKTEEADRIIQAMPLDKQMETATAAMGAVMKCGLGPITGTG